MPLKRDLIYIDGKDETDRIEKYSLIGDRCLVVFKNNKKDFYYSKTKLQL